MNGSRPGTIHVLLALLVVFSSIAALRATSTVTMPVALAFFVVILAWPLQQWLERKRVPRRLAYCGTLLGILVVSAAFVGLLYVCGQNVAAKAPEYEDRIAEIYRDVRSWLDDQKAAADRGDEDDEERASPEMILQAMRAIAAWSYGFLGIFTLTVTFTVLGLIEVHRFREKVGSSVQPALAQKLKEAGREVGRTLQRYVLARTIVSGTTGVLVGLYTWAIGLDFPLVWGVSSFLLNYIPVLGSIVAVIPPSLIALLQPEWWLFVATLGGLTIIQFSIGNLADPRIEGRILSLSPFVLFLSIVFWGWVWGIPGALMGIPITAAIVTFCRKFESTRTFAELIMK